jgi:hypothetical protein
LAGFHHFLSLFSTFAEDRLVMELTWTVICFLNFFSPKFCDVTYYTSLLKNNNYGEILQLGDLEFFFSESEKIMNFLVFLRDFFSHFFKLENKE